MFAIRVKFCLPVTCRQSVQMSMLLLFDFNPQLVAQNMRL
jgi:hypothetical protein